MENLLSRARNGVALFLSKAGQHDESAVQRQSGATFDIRNFLRDDDVVNPRSTDNRSRESNNIRDAESTGKDYVRSPIRSILQ